MEHKTNTQEVDLSKLENIINRPEVDSPKVLEYTMLMAQGGKVLEFLDLETLVDVLVDLVEEDLKTLVDILVDLVEVD